MALSYEFRNIPNKGIGMFASHDLEPGTVVLRERPALIVRKGFFGRIDDGDVVLAVEALSATQRKAFFALHEGESGHPTREARIFHVNCFSSPDNDYNYLYLQISRINHSCVPNAADVEVSKDWRDGGEIKAIRRIAKGEEVCINYRPSHLSCLTRAQRQEFLEQTWDFECECECCSLDDAAMALSDARRRIICALRYKIYLNQPVPDAFSTTTNYRPISVELANLFDAQTMDNLKQTRNLGYHVLLSRCMEAEGLDGDMVAKGYFFEAHALVSKMQERPDNVVLFGWARNAMRWMRNCIDYCNKLEGVSRSRELVHLVASWKERAIPELKVALALEREGDAAMQRDPYSVVEVHELWREIDSVMPQEREQQNVTSAFAFRFTTLEDGEPGVVCMTREQCLLYLYQQKNDQKLQHRARKQGEAFVRGWVFAEGGGIGSFSNQDECATS